MKDFTLKIVGITGGIGSGKSTIAGILKDLGAQIINADKLCHQLLNTKAIKDKVINIWPDAVNGNSGEINRTKLAKIVFSKRKNIECLNKILHPIVIRQIKKQISGVKRKKKKDTVIIDAALLEETKLSYLCNIIVFVDTKSSSRKKRCKETRNWDENEVRRREELQKPIEEKKKGAQFIINNDNSINNTTRQVYNLWNNLQKQ